MDLSRSSRGRMLLLGVVALVAVAIAVPALAQNASETDAPSASNEGDRPRDERFVEACSAFAAALAEELDLPVDRVDDALTAVRERLQQERSDDHRAALEERLDAAVADGELTREQATRSSRPCATWCWSTTTRACDPSACCHAPRRSNHRRHRGGRCSRACRSRRPTSRVVR